MVAATFLTEDSYPQDMWRLWNIAEPLTLNRYSYCVGNPVNYVDKSGHWVYEEEQQKIIEKHATMNVHEQLQKGTPNVQQVTTFLSALHELNMPNASVDFALHFDYARNGSYVKKVEEMAEKQNVNYACEVKVVRYSDSTKQLIIQLEGKPFLKPRISIDAKGKIIITIGYGYDFTEEDPKMFNEYLERNEKGEIVVKKEMSLEEAEATIEKAAQKKGIISALDKFIFGDGYGNTEKQLNLNQNQYDALFSYFYSNGPSVFTDSKYEEWKGYGGEYAVRAEARKELRDYIISNNGSYEDEKIVQLFIMSKGANIKYEYEERRRIEGTLFVTQ